jgi:hypothetical protein
MSAKKNTDKTKSSQADAQIKEVYSVWGPAEAEVIKSFLESHGIQCILKGLVVQSVHPFSADGLGEIKIFVLEKDFGLAKKLISEKASSPHTPDQED